MAAGRRGWNGDLERELALEVLAVDGDDGAAAAFDKVEQASRRDRVQALG